MTMSADELKKQRRRERRIARKNRGKHQKALEEHGLISMPSTDIQKMIVEPKLLTDTQIIYELRRLKNARQHWEEDFTRANKEELIRRVRTDLEDTSNQVKALAQSLTKLPNKSKADKEKREQVQRELRQLEGRELSTMIFDALYLIINRGEPEYIKGAGLAAPSEELEAEKRSRREMRRQRRLGRSSTPSNNRAETKNKNNPLQADEIVVRSSCGHQRGRLKQPGENTMIIENGKNTLRLKVRTKGAPNYANNGDNRAVTIDGKKANLVLNPKEGSKSKRVGLAWDKKWYFVDDEEAHKFVSGLKGTTAFTTKARSTNGNGKSDEKPAAKGKGKSDEKPAAKGKAKKGASKGKATKGKAAPAPAEAGA